MKKSIKRSLIIGAGLVLSVPFALSFATQNVTNNNYKNSTTNLASINKDAASDVSGPGQLTFYWSYGGSYPSGYFSVSNGKLNFTALKDAETKEFDFNHLKDPAYIVSILNSDSDIIVNKTFLGGDTGVTIKTWFDSISSKVSSGDFIQVQSVDYWLNTSFNGGPIDLKNVTIGIGTSSLFLVPPMSVWQYENVLNFTTSNDNTIINIDIPNIDGKTINATVTTNSKGIATYTIPSDVPLNGVITYYMTLGSGESTPVTTIYNEFITNSKGQTYTFNLMKFGSYNPSQAQAQSGNAISLTNLSDIPLQFIGDASISFKLIGDVKGTYNLFQVDPNNNWSVGNLKNYNAGTDYSQDVSSMKIDVSSDQLSNGQSPWTIRPNGDTVRYHFTVNTSGLTNSTNTQEPFTFQLQMTINAGTYYREIPTFDNMTFNGQSYLISSWATNNGEEYDKEIFDTGNKYYGAEFITRGIRFFEPDSEYVLNLNGQLGSSTSGILDSFNADYEVKLYDKIWTTYNEINGRVLNPTNGQLGFHQGWVHLSVFTDNHGGWFTTAHGTYTTADHFYWFLVPGWILFHEIGHIFNQNVLSGYFGNEVYSNIYTYLMAIAFGPITNELNGSEWNAGNISNTSISQALLPAYTYYFKNGAANSNYFKNYNSGLRWFVQLLYYFPNYVTKFAEFNNKFVMSYKFSAWQDDNPGYVDYTYPNLSWFAYFLASQYQVNVIPSLAIMGYNITNQNLIKFIIDNATTTLNVLPHTLPYWNASDTTKTIITSPVLKEFSQFEKEVLSPIFINPILDSETNTYTLQGMDNPNYDINVEYNSKTYQVICDSKGKFTLTLPFESGVSSATIWATNNGQSSLKQTFYLEQDMINNAYKFTINSNANGSSPGLVFYSTPSNKLVAEAGTSNYYYDKTSLWAQIFFSMYNAEGQEIVKPIFVSWQGQGSTSVSTRNGNTPYTTILIDDLNKALENMQLQIGDVIDVTMPTSNGTNAGVTYTQGTSNENSNNLQYFSNVNGTTTWKIVDTESGLYPLNSSFISTMQTSSSFNTLPGASLYVNSVLYSSANNIGTNQISDNQPSLIPNTKYNIELKVGNSVIYQTNSTNSTNTSSIQINNIWKQPVYSLNFEDNNINFVNSWSHFSPYPQSSAGIFFVMNLIDPTTNITKFTWTVTAKSPIKPPSSVAYQIGDILQIQYYDSSDITANNVYNFDSSSSTYVVDPSVHIVNTNKDKNNYFPYNFYITPTGLSLIPFQMVNVNISGGITSNSATLSLGNKKYLIPITNSSFTGLIPFYGESSKNNSGTLEIDSKTYTENVSTNDDTQTLNFNIPTQVEINNVNNVINAIKNSNIDAKPNTIVSTISQDTIEGNIIGLPSLPSGMSYKYTNVKSNSITGVTTFKIEVLGPSGFSETTPTMSVNFETQAQIDALNSTIDLINKAKIVALSNIFTNNVSTNQSFANQIKGMPSVPAGMSFTYQNIIVNNTTGDVTFDILVKDANNNTQTSKTITATGFVVSSTSNPTSTGTNSNSSSASSSDAGVIAGAVTGSVLGAAVIGALAWYLIRRKNHK